MLLDGISMTDDGVASGINLEKTISIPGTVSTTTGLPKWFLRRDAKIINVFIDAHAAPAGDLIRFHVLKNGILWFVAELPDGSDRITLPKDELAAAGDRITLDIVRVGSTSPGEYLTFTFEYEFTK